jgi:hypothetical protein
MPTLNPSPSGFQFSVSKNTKTPPGAGASILPLVVIGYCSDTTNAPIATPVPIATPDAAVSAGGIGPAVELAACALDDNGQVDLVHLVNSGASNAATYGAITQTWANASAPSIIAEPSTLPSDDFDVSILWTVGGFAVGTAGNKYRVSLDNGLHYFAEQALGTASLISLPNGAGSYRLVAPLATLVARGADIRTKVLAHAAGTGTYHGSADGGPYTITTPTNLATLLTACGEMKTVALAHVVKTTGSPAIHGAADSTASTVITALTAPTTLYEAQVFLAAFSVAFFGDGTANSGHTVRISPAVHGAADATNTLAAIGSLGTITANDIVTLSTEGPTPDATELVAAIDSLRAYTGQIGTITFASPIPASYIAAVYAALKELWKYNKFSDVVASFRRPTLTETTTQYATALEALDGIVAVDFRMCSGATYHQSALILTADGAATPRRPHSWFVSMAKARNEPQVDLQFVTPQQGVRIRNSLGRLLPGCLDEQSGLLYSVLRRTIGTRTDPTRDSNGGVFVTQDLVLYDSNSDWVLGPYTSVVNHALRTAAPVVVNASAAPDGFPGFDQEVIDGLTSDVLAVVEPEIVDKRRAKAVRFSITDTTGGKLKWKMVVVPNDYVINGVELESSVVLERSV